MILPLLLNLIGVVDAALHIFPPQGAAVVRQNTTTPGEFGAISDAVASLPADNSTQSIFIFPGAYVEQVNITRPGPTTLYGFTVDDRTYEFNTVTIIHNASLATEGHDDLTGTLRVLKDDFSMYNINLQNIFGQAKTNGQALALSANGNRMGIYASKLLSFQDTLYANVGTQVYAGCYIEGAVDFIFGSKGTAFFKGNTISSISAGSITASGRGSNDSRMYVFDNNRLILGNNAAPNTSGRVFLGRPWGDFARVVFKNTEMGSHLNKTLWSIWDPGDERTDHVFLATAGNKGPGAVNVTLAPFATALTVEEANEYTIATAIGDDWADWVDKSYLEGPRLF